MRDNRKERNEIKNNWESAIQWSRKMIWMIRNTEEENKNKKGTKKERKKENND